MPERYLAGKSSSLPDVTHGGVLIEKPDPQPEIRHNAENSKDWPYASEASYLYEKAKLLRDRLLDPIARLDRDILPDPIIGFDDMRNYRTLAGYWLKKDVLGLPARIDFNTEHYKDADREDGTKAKEYEYGRWSQLEILLHEYAHMWQQTVGQHPVNKNIHNTEFTDKLEGMGLHCNARGQHFAVATEPFSLVMQELGIEKPADVPREEMDISWFLELFKREGKEHKGRSTLSLWECACGQKVRVGKKDWPGAVCNKCGQQYCEHTAGQTIFESPNKKGAPSESQSDQKE